MLKQLDATQLMELSIEPSKDEQHKVLRSSTYKFNPNGHGGHRRSSQILELISSLKYEAHDIDEVLSSRLSRYFNGLNFLSKYRFKVFPHYRVISVCGLHYQTYQAAFQKHSGRKLVLWEDTKNFVAPYVAREQGYKVIALPHNIESLVSGQTDIYTQRKPPKNLENEIRHLNMADSVFCISREEQWLLRLFGVNADFLPYYPPSQILENLLQVRESRLLAQNNGFAQNNQFLILGTAHNTPTYQGMLQQIHLLQSLIRKVDFEVDVAGFGTEKLKEHCTVPRVNFHGSLPQEKLNTLLSSTKAVLIHQNAGAGALTRIPELLIAGIPIIANGNASRSAFHYSGIHTYDSLSEFATLLNSTFEFPPIPPRPLVAEQRFIECFNQLLSNKRNLKC